jgi:hypothetical protein
MSLQSPSNTGGPFAVGRKVTKDFGVHGFFNGVVIDYNRDESSLYHVRWEDGDEEDMDVWEYVEAQRLWYEMQNIDPIYDKLRKRSVGCEIAIKEYDHVGEVHFGRVESYTGADGGVSDRTYRIVWNDEDDMAHFITEMTMSSYILGRELWLSYGDEEDIDEKRRKFLLTQSKKQKQAASKGVRPLPPA